MNTVNPSGLVSSTASTSVSGSAVSTLSAISRVSCFSLSCVAANASYLTKNGPAGPFRNCSKCGETMVASGGRKRPAHSESQVDDDCHGAVVLELDRHSRAEDACLDVDAEVAKRRAGVLVQRLREFGSRGPGERR